VHAANGKIFCQLWHMGPERPTPAVPHPEALPVSPSGFLRPGKPYGVALDKAGIREVIASFARAARDSKRVGFDGVEIHGAHGYLVDSFLSEVTNQRTDEYGGSLEKRLRFAVETIEAIRGEVGDDFPISFRTSQWKSQDYGARIYRDPRELEISLAAFAKAGVDIIHSSTRRFWEPEFEGSPLCLAGWVKQVSDLCSIAVGSVTLNCDFTTVDESDAKGLGRLANARPTANVDAVVERLGKGEFDMIAVGRAMLSNPDWLDKVIAGKETEINPFTKSDLKVLN
jgi:2,4-dienoyl-CoA reductase-like NADH-dependent reductase (Old Yellow Enzyme family)